MCLIPFKSHTHTQIQAHSHTRCGLAHLAVSRGGGDRRVVLLYLIDRLCLASPRGTAIFPHSTGFSFGLKNSLSKDFHQHVIAATWVKFATAAECMLVQVCASLSRTAYAKSRISIVLHPTPAHIPHYFVPVRYTLAEIHKICTGFSYDVLHKQVLSISCHNAWQVYPWFDF